MVFVWFRMINGGRGLSPDGCFYKQINKMVEHI